MFGLDDSYPSSESLSHESSCSDTEDQDDQDRRMGIRHEPPKKYSNAPEPSKSAMKKTIRRESQTGGGISSRIHEESRILYVHFGDVQVYSHGVELGCNPSVSSGPPLELSWELVSTEDYDLDAHEWNPRRPRKCPKQMILSKAERRRRLYRAGFSKSAIRAVEVSLQEESDDENDPHFLY